MSGATAQAGPAPGSLAASTGEPVSRVRDHDDATRFLCAAAHLEPEFARRVTREVMVAEHRLPAPPRGFDLATVLRHCVAARSRRLYRDVAIIGVLLLAALIAPWAVVAWLGWLAGLRALAQAGRTAPARAAAGFLTLIWLAAAILPTLLVFTRLDPYDIRSFWQPAQLGAGGLPHWLGVPLAAAAASWLVVFVDQVAQYVMVAERLRDGRFEPGRWLSAEPAWTQHALAVLGRRLADGRLANRPVLDPAVPFLGAGRQVLRRRWLVDLGPAASASAPFDTADLLDRICERLGDGLGPLDPARPRPSGAPGTAVDRGSNAVTIDQYAVSTAPALAAKPAEQFGDDPGAVRLLPDAPALTGASGGPRVFRRISVGHDAAGMRVTVFLNASAGAGLLQVELYGHVLGPVAARYRIADHTPPFSPAAAAGCAARALRTLPAAVFAAPASVLRTAADPVLRRHNRALLAHAAAAGLTVDAGARFDVREAAAEASGVDRFTDEDANLYLAVIERRVRDELRPLLPASTTEF